MPLPRLLALSACAAVIGASMASAQPAADPHAPPNAAVKSPGDTTGGPLAKGHNSFTKAEARSRLENAGYTDVTSLNLDHDGLWQAHANRDGQAVHVALDYKGDIAVQ